MKARPQLTREDNQRVIRHHIQTDHRFLCQPVATGQGDNRGFIQQVKNREA